MEEAATEPPPEPTAEPAEPTEAAAPPAPEAAATPEEDAGGPAPAPASQPPAPTHADAAVAVAPHALGCVFFGLLLHRLNEKELAWPIVFAPLFAADAVEERALRERARARPRLARPVEDLVERRHDASMKVGRRRHANCKTVGLGMVPVPPRPSTKLGLARRAVDVPS